MITQDQVDLDLLKASSEGLLVFFKETGNKERVTVEIFNALFELTSEFISAGHEAENLTFDAQDICERLNDRRENYSEAKAFISRNKNAFDKLVDKKIKEIEHFFRLNKLQYLPVICNTASVGGNKNKTMYYIGLKAFNDFFSHEVEISTSKNDAPISNEEITYTVPRLPKTPTWLKPLLRLEVVGWKFKTYFMLPILAILLGYGLFLWNVFSLSTTSLLVSSVLGGICLGIYFILKPFYEAIELKINMAPQWLLNFSTVNAQIRYEKTGELKPNGRPIRALELVVYKAQCPICGNEVSVEAGKNFHKGRLIGVCEESPREHIFSFDHIVKRGKLLS